jgi:hypothetical protein
MRAVIEDAGSRSEGVRGLLFVRADVDLETALASGAGLEIFRR